MDSYERIDWMDMEIKLYSTKERCFTLAARLFMRGQLQLILCTCQLPRASCKILSCGFSRAFIDFRIYSQMQMDHSLR